MKFAKKLKDFKSKVFHAKHKYINNKICNSKDSVNPTWKFINSGYSN